jgi:hypothetical protein
LGAVCPPVAGRIIAIDGKAMRDPGRSGLGMRALHQVSACVAEYGITLGQRAGARKSSEIASIEELLPAVAITPWP